MTVGAEDLRYRVRAADVVAERDAIAGILSDGFPGLTAASIDERLSAQYQSNPAGPADCVVLEEAESGELAGVQGLLRRRFESAKGAIEAAVMADYVIRPAHRALGPALQLLKGAIERARSRGGFLFGFPNAKASVVFARAGLAPRLWLTRYVSLIRSEATIRRRLSPAYRFLAGGVAAVGNVALAIRHLVSKGLAPAELSWAEPKSFGREFDELWSALDRAGLVIGVRSAGMLAWRYPAAPSRRVALARRGADGPLVGYVVWSVADRLISIHDVCCAHLARDLAPLLVGFVDRARRTPAEAVYLEFAGPPALAAAVRRAGFVPRETSPVHLVVADGSFSAEGLAASLYLTGFDRDTD